MVVGRCKHRQAIWAHLLTFQRLVSVITEITDNDDLSFICRVTVGEISLTVKCSVSSHADV